MSSGYSKRTGCRMSASITDLSTRNDRVLAAAWTQRSRMAELSPTADPRIVLSEAAALQSRHALNREESLGLDSKGHRGVRGLVHRADQGGSPFGDAGCPGCRRTARGGPTLGRPLVDRLKGANMHHLKELRPGSQGRSEIRIIFAFDPTRSALLLLGGDKAGNWQRWYRENIPIAERLYIEYTAEN